MRKCSPCIASSNRRLGVASRILISCHTFCIFCFASFSCYLWQKCFNVAWCLWCLCSFHFFSKLIILHIIKVLLCSFNFCDNLIFIILVNLLRWSLAWRRARNLVSIWIVWNELLVVSIIWMITIDLSQVLRRLTPLSGLTHFCPTKTFSSGPSHT